MECVALKPILINYIYYYFFFFFSFQNALFILNFVIEIFWKKKIKKQTNKY